MNAREELFALLGAVPGADAVLVSALTNHRLNGSTFYDTQSRTGCVYGIVCNEAVSSAVAPLVYQLLRERRPPERLSPLENAVFLIGGWGFFGKLQARRLMKWLTLWQEDAIVRAANAGTYPEPAARSVIHA